MSFISCDIEADGPYPGDYSMVCFGAVVVEPSLTKTFYGTVRPISEQYKPDALAISGISRDEHLSYREPEVVMAEFAKWIKDNSTGHPVFITDNPAFDFAFMNYYFHKYYGSNPFGFSARRIGDIYCGLEKDAYSKWKYLRKTEHDHNPVNDAKGNAEVILHMKEKMGLKIGLK